MYETHLPLCSTAVVVQPPVWGAGAAAFGAWVGDSAPLWDPALKRVVGRCTLSLHRGFLSAVWWPHAELFYASDIWEIWVCSAMPYKGISAEHASIMPVGYYLYNPFGLDYLLYWNLFHIRGWERAVRLNLLVPRGGERTVCLWGVGSCPKNIPMLRWLEQLAWKFIATVICHPPVLPHESSSENR